MSDQVPKELLDAGRGYEKLFVPSLFTHWPPHLIRAAGIGAGNDVLDVACGTGVLSRAVLSVVGADGQVTGLDLAPGMIAAAREVEPAIDWRLGPAEALEFQDMRFDAVVSQFGIMFFQDKQAAVHEMVRVLKPGGRLAIAVFNSISENPAYLEIASILRREVGEAAAQADEIAFSMGDATELSGLLETAGCRDIRTETRVETARFPGTRQMVEADLRGWLPLFGIHLDEARISDLLAMSSSALARFVNAAGEVVFPASAHVVSGRR